MPFLIEFWGLKGKKQHDENIDQLTAAFVLDAIDPRLWKTNQFQLLPFLRKEKMG